MQHYYSTFTDAYTGLLRDVYENPDFICSPRGQKIKEKLGVKFTIENPRNRLPFIQERNFNVGYFVAEGLWYLSGCNLTSWISYYSKFWEKITDDGVTANSAYGARIFKPHEYCGQRQVIEYDRYNNPSIENYKKDVWTQWNWIIEELCADNDSRRAVIHIRTPFDSKYAKKDVPCTLTLQFFIRDDQLFQIVSMRSSDAWLGIANDVPAFTIFQELLALELSNKLQRPITLGTYTHISNSFHIYERNFESVEKLINSKFITFPVEMPEMTSLPPIEQLLNFEKQIRNSNEPSLVIKDIIGLESYWKDWLIVLTAHRYNKLGELQSQQKMLQQTAWEGFRFFEK